MITTIERRLALWSQLPLSHQEDMQARIRGGEGRPGGEGVVMAAPTRRLASECSLAAAGQGCNKGSTLSGRGVATCSVPALSQQAWSAVLVI